MKILLHLWAKEWENITNAFSTIAGTEDVIDAGDDAVDIGDMAAVIHGS